ncbi:e3 ubiquitin-protein ligase XIAP [Caerostris darwini]|uniref:E3 ubiquitin-protein ligase XIAP n=1 Tax=Caerostris darwini TaxID=1538125 RepID=A0AAV4W2T0_9ARAC|nr:e3 ubiquitin-protein ligase XIAP [Caerostris darwini]
MKYEVKRYNSFMGRWPLSYVKPKDLATNGFFYLLSEDRVQCAFCSITIDDRNAAETPLKKHIKKAPKCPFLMASNVGNIPMQQQKPVEKSLSKLIPNTKSNSTSLSGQAKYPRMTELKNRLATYKDWPLMMLSPRQLSECGLLYIDNEDIVTFFYCGGSLGNRELNDNPWVEHEKYFPDCRYLNLVTCHRNLEQNSTHHNLEEEKTSSTHSLAQSEMIRHACDIFPSSLVQNVVTHHLYITGGHYISFLPFCVAIFGL